MRGKSEVCTRTYNPATGTHDAGLYGDIERAVVEILPTKTVGSSRHGLHLGMGGPTDECPSKS